MMSQMSPDIHGVGINLKTTQTIFLECRQYADHAIIINIRQSVSDIMHNMLGVSVWWKVPIQPDISYGSTDGEIRCMYEAVKKNKVIRRYTEALELHTGSHTVHWEDNTSRIYAVEAKIVTPRVKHIDIPVCFL